MLPESASVITDSLAQYPHVPLYYILSRSLTPEQEEGVHNALRITPIYFSIITDLSDTNLASKFSTVILQVTDLPSAKALALQLYETTNDHPSRSIIIDTANVLIGVYADREVEIPC